MTPGEVKCVYKETASSYLLPWKWHPFLIAWLSYSQDSSFRTSFSTCDILGLEAFFKGTYYVLSTTLALEGIQK